MAEVHFLRNADKSNLPLIPAGVEKTEDIWWDKYTGTAENLVAAGIVEMHQLPGQPGRGKTMVSYKPDGTPTGKGGAGCREPGSWSVARYGKNRFIVSVRIAEDEENRRRERSDAEETEAIRALEAQEAQKNLTERLDAMPKTADEFLQRMVNYVTSEYGPLGILRSAVTSGGWPADNIGFKLDTETMRAMEALLSRLVMLISNGGIEPDPQGLDAHIARLKRNFSKIGAPEQRPSPKLKVVCSESA